MRHSTRLPAGTARGVGVRLAIRRAIGDAWGMNLSLRHRLPELMDQPGLDQQLHQQALDGLRRVNRVSRSAGIFWPALRALAKHSGGDGLHVLDVACGGGDVSLSLAVRARQTGIRLRIDGCDVSGVAVQHAELQAARAGVETSFFRCDVLSYPLPLGYDAVICSLFLHHLDEEQAVGLLRNMAGAARRLVLVNDLRRTRAGYVLAWVGCRLLSRSPIVHHDGPLSVRAAFSLCEVAQLAEQAGLSGASISRRWPQRFLLSWRRD
jgi:2-polyprenyl-3-methyl-5-hydroxy-6-metoxy-1,4-benzoquinol methylase